MTFWSPKYCPEFPGLIFQIKISGNSREIHFDRFFVAGKFTGNSAGNSKSKIGGCLPVFKCKETNSGALWKQAGARGLQDPGDGAGRGARCDRTNRFRAVRGPQALEWAAQLPDSVNDGRPQWGRVQSEIGLRNGPNFHEMGGLQWHPIQSGRVRVRPQQTAPDTC